MTGEYSIPLTPPKVKTVTVHFMPMLNLPDDIIQGTGKIGQRAHATELGYPIGYAVWKDNHTTLYPTGNVLKIELDL